MGNKIYKCFGCVPTPNPDPLIPQHTYLQILVVGDSGVGKSTLIDNYIKKNDGDERDESTDEKIRIINANPIVTNDTTGVVQNVSMTIIDIQGDLNMITKQIRDSYYRTSNLIFMVYNVGKVDSLYNIKATWQKELDEATKNQKQNNVQLILVGVNPEARNELIESEIYEPDADDEENIEIFRKNTKRKSINKDQAIGVAQRLSYRNSSKRTKHKEVGKNLANIQEFFQDVIADYVFGDSE